MESQAVVIREPKIVELGAVRLNAPGESDLVVDVTHSGISTGTERLFWSGEMPAFPGMGYPLVPGYESVGRVVSAPPAFASRVGEFVFVPGSNCFADVRGLFGANASRLVVPQARAVTVSESLGERGVLLALAATAYHASANGAAQPDLIIGHGVVGRLLARIAVLAGAKPVVWERNPARHDGAEGYEVRLPQDDNRHDYKHIYDASGDETLLDRLISRLAPGGEIVLAGFYAKLSFAFAPAFMREARLRIAAQWQPEDLMAVQKLAESGALNLDGLITHHAAATDVREAYQTAFETPECLKMIIDWSSS
ncbi:MAG: chlorophyll synthesis pathway protein BchC [Acidocella sp. 20-57-95]|nr:MAG: chlorophyll synthesis pathway protein BchC [Acidocella sp. 20-57-95]OYV60595.1 MAG: chlorophyll synthesis pathway protein BchC [Acidocella sp. 21-58-7]HQT64872.1 chlorophyll synthesis pathway protein BchC [Acidocella sp.]HQU04665.1 chlorophyll synthesis pathway protein BchC [Acidocella sp.]